MTDGCARIGACSPGNFEPCMASLRIREATPDDCDALGRLWQELMRFHAVLDADEYAVKDEALPVWLDWLDSNITSDSSALFVADAQGEVVGYVLGKEGERPPVYADRRLGEIHEISVTHAWRRRGVGRRLVAALLGWFGERHLTRIRVSAAACNPTSNAFWQAMGFQPCMNSMRRLIASGP